MSIASYDGRLTLKLPDPVTPVAEPIPLTAVAQANGPRLSTSQAGPRAVAGHTLWPGLARLKTARLGPAHGFGPGHAHHYSVREWREKPNSFR